MTSDRKSYTVRQWEVAWRALFKATKRLFEMNKAEGHVFDCKVKVGPARRVKAKKVWIDAGYLDNGRCPYMLGSFDGPCCMLHYKHAGDHKVDPR